MLTAADVLVVLFLQHKGFRYIEALVASLIFIIGGCFAYEIRLPVRRVMAILGGLIPPARDCDESRNAVRSCRNSGARP